MQDKYRALNQIQSLTNACVSHELRNPLNSIVSHNYEKRFLYDQMKSILLQKEMNPKKLRQKLLKINKLMMEGLSTQENSG